MSKNKTIEEIGVIQPLHWVTREEVRAAHDRYEDMRGDVQIMDIRPYRIRLRDIKGMRHEI